MRCAIHQTRANSKLLAVFAAVYEREPYPSAYPVTLFAHMGNGGVLYVFCSCAKHLSATGDAISEVEVVVSDSDLFLSFGQGVCLTYRLPWGVPPESNLHYTTLQV